ncbi:Uncharacterised protein [Salmonella enterica subsp. enterica]|nr:Uncharacterised protein [Salmonella enterica subsp. enterica]
MVVAKLAMRFQFNFTGFCPTLKRASSVKSWRPVFPGGLTALQLKCQHYAHYHLHYALLAPTVDYAQSRVTVDPVERRSKPGPADRYTAA